MRSPQSTFPIVHKAILIAKKMPSKDGNFFLQIINKKRFKYKKSYDIIPIYYYCKAFTYCLNCSIINYINKLKTKKISQKTENNKL